MTLLEVRAIGGPYVLAPRLAAVFLALHARTAKAASGLAPLLLLYGLLLALLAGAEGADLALVGGRPGRAKVVLVLAVRRKAAHGVVARVALPFAPPLYFLRFRIQAFAVS